VLNVAFPVMEKSPIFLYRRTKFCTVSSIWMVKTVCVYCSSVWKQTEVLSKQDIKTKKVGEEPSIDGKKVHTKKNRDTESIFFQEF
jgi:hypothetical protein